MVASGARRAKHFTTTFPFARSVPLRPFLGLWAAWAACAVGLPVPSRAEPPAQEPPRAGIARTSDGILPTREPSNPDHPPFVLATQALELSTLEQGDHVIVVWTTWAPGAEGLAPRIERLNALFSEYAQVSSVVFQEESGAVSRFLARQRVADGEVDAENARQPESPVPVFLDTAGELCRRYGVRTLPQLLILRDGEALFRGPLPVDPDPVIARHLGVDALQPEDRRARIGNGVAPRVDFGLGVVAAPATAPTTALEDAHNPRD